MRGRNEGRTSNDRGDEWYRSGDWICITPGEGDGDTNLDINDLFAMMWLLLEKRNDESGASDSA